MPVDLNGQFSITFKSADFGKSVGGIRITLDTEDFVEVSGPRSVLTNASQVIFSLYELASNKTVSDSLAYDTSGTLELTSDKAKITIQNARPWFGKKLAVGKLTEQATVPFIFYFSGPITLEEVT